MLRGSRARAEAAARRLEEAGAATEIRVDPTVADRWIRPELSLDKVHCAKCGATLFRALPGVTTPDDVTRFARESDIDPGGEIARSGWIHPGVYCPRGCGYVTANLDD